MVVMVVVVVIVVVVIVAVTVAVAVRVAVAVTVAVAMMMVVTIVVVMVMAVVVVVVVVVVAVGQLLVGLLFGKLVVIKERLLEELPGVELRRPGRACAQTRGGEKQMSASPSRHNSHTLNAPPFRAWPAP